MAEKLQGIDLSVHNTVQSFQAIKNSGKSFVFLRLGWANSNGTITKDTKFDEYYKNALSVGLDIGVYVFSYLKDVTYAKIAAQNTIKLIKDLVITMPVAFDYENADISKTLTKEQIDYLVENGKMPSEEKETTYEKMSLTKLKEIAKEKGIKGYSKMDKEEIIKELEK